ncbi:response regulator [Gloeobacter kilaueensis]|uniref:Two-component response regulator n=1 Tax=Gloeobacter kilaueensis (strain ATCC BAA-2537 / CCAP 1431/1 / ULC 316 / JS1) TaxID=1183438 RepID=U5QSP3_GLOK1|nr:response regulator [Gloeobacter kilaueensis]AGY60694.1 two-component response regulator [Gloeobacter kilaueensis JS1]
MLERPIQPPLDFERMESELRHRFGSHRDQDWALLYIDLSNFRLYNQIYGRVAGEKMLSTLQSTLDRCVTGGGLLYRLGAQEFLALVEGRRAEGLACEICLQWEKASLGFYTRQDRQRGFLVGTDRHGIGRRCPLVTVNIGIVPAAGRREWSLAQLFSSALQTNLDAQANQSCSYCFANPEAHLQASSVADSLSHRVLVVEPDAALAYLLQTTLEMRGYEVVVTSSGQEAFKLAVTNPPRVIILDLFTSDLPAGPFLCQELRRQPELEKTFLIVAATNADREESLAAGADLFVPKPFELNELLSWIDRLIEESAKVADLPTGDPAFRGFRR